MTTLELDQALNALIAAGKSAEAFEKYYAEDVVAQENDEPERRGRAAWTKGRQELEKNLKSFNAKVFANAANGDVSFSEWEYNVEIAGMGAIRTIQVAVRHWKDGRVVRERFYHK
jgi:ketosteroid isomerase-like protein